MINALESRQNLLTALVSAGQESGDFKWRECCEAPSMTGSSRAAPETRPVHFRTGRWCMALNDGGAGGKKRRMAAKDSARGARAP